MARGADVARGTNADVTRHARPHGRAARAHAARRWRTGSADAWQRPCESTRAPEGVPRGKRGGELAFEGSTG